MKIAVIYKCDFLYIKVLLYKQYKDAKKFYAYGMCI